MPRAFDQFVDPGPVSFELFGLIPAGRHAGPIARPPVGVAVCAGRRPEVTAVQLGALRGVDHRDGGRSRRAVKLVPAGGSSGSGESSGDGVPASTSSVQRSAAR